jgi:hypothetical protein
MISDATKRSILRSIHIVLGIPIIGYVCSPFEELPNYAPAVRFVALAVILLTGFWMWKGPCPSTTYFETIGLTRRCSERLPALRFYDDRQLKLNMAFDAHRLAVAELGP